VQVLGEALVLCGALALFAEAQLRLRPSARLEPRLVCLVRYGGVSMMELAREVVAEARARGDKRLVQKAKGLYQACKGVEQLLLPSEEEEEQEGEEGEEEL
jgi:hypothetical protein